LGLSFSESVALLDVLSLEIFGLSVSELVALVDVLSFGIFVEV
jgi:hypothetical protein